MIDFFGTTPNDQEAALALLRFIAKFEKWSDREEGAPSRDEIITCYADCVAATRGHPPVTIEGSLVIAAEASGPNNSPAHGAARYEMAQDLTPPEALPDEPELIAANENLEVDI